MHVMKSIFQNTDYTHVQKVTKRSKIEDNLTNVNNESIQNNQNVPVDENVYITCLKAAIEYFIENENLVDILLDDLVCYSKTVQSLFNDVTNMHKIQQHVFCGRFDYNLNIIDYLEFLKFLAVNSSYLVSNEHLLKIVKFLVDEPENDYDKEVVLEWLQDVIKRQYNTNDSDSISSDGDGGMGCKVQVFESDSAQDIINQKLMEYE